jgi:Holliday junction resolvase-like predicted endonuclease
MGVGSSTSVFVNTLASLFCCPQGWIVRIAIRKDLPYNEVERGVGRTRSKEKGPSRWVVPAAEIDVIAAWKQQVIVFVEVKTWGRSRVDPGRPADAVDDVKQRKLCKTALHYAKRHGLLETRGRFDVIEIRLTETMPNLCHIQAAFQSEDRFQLHS